MRAAHPVWRWAAGSLTSCVVVAATDRLATYPWASYRNHQPAYYENTGQWNWQPTGIPAFESEIRLRQAEQWLVCGKFRTCCDRWMTPIQYDAMPLYPTACADGEINLQRVNVEKLSNASDGLSSTKASCARKNDTFNTVSFYNTITAVSSNIPQRGMPFILFGLPTDQHFVRLSPY